MREVHVGVILAIMAICVAQGHSAEPPNLARNPSFEEVKDGRPVAWGIADEVSRLTDEKAHTGKLSVKIDDRSEKLGSSISSDLIPVQAGKKHTIGAWGFHLDGGGVGLYVRIFTKDKKEVPTGPATYHKCLSSRKKRWTETRFVMTIPENCAFINVWIHSYSNSIVTAYVDDVSVREGALVEEEVAMAPKPYETTRVTFREGDHPFLFVTKEEIEQIRQKAQQHEWAGRALKSFLQGMEKRVAEPIELPERGGGWYHYYACPKDGHGLKTLSPTQHQCRKCGAIYTGEPYDTVALMGRHNHLSRTARDFGLAYQFTGDKRYAEKVKEVLLGYAKKYNSYALHDVRGPNEKSRSAARVGPQTLDESCWIIPVAQGYDLIASSGVLSDAEKKDIEDNLLRAAAMVIKKCDAGISNWQSWHNAGLGAVAFCLKDKELAEDVINGKSGFLFQMANSVTDDGFWYEGSWGYHYYALSAHVHLTETACRSGVDLYKNMRYKSMFDSPMKFMAPNKMLPAFHDAHLCSAIGPANLYEVAFRRWGDPNYAWVLGQRSRGGVEALVVGAPEIPTVKDPALSSCNFPAAGWFVLRSGASLDSMYLALDYGPHGGGHGHPDKLGFSFYAFGDFVAHDPGCVAYALPIHGQWYKQTLSHNTIVVDETSQEECEGELLLFCSCPSFRAGKASANLAYEPAKMSRLVAMSSDYVVIADDVTDSEIHTYDWAYHGVGDLKVALPLKAQAEPLGKDDGYQHVTSVQRGAADADWTASWTSKDRNVKLTMLGVPGTEVIFGVGWGPVDIGKTPMVIARRKAKESRYIALLEPYRTRSAIASFTSVNVPDAKDAICLAVNSDLILFGEEGKEKRTPALSSDGRLAVASSAAKSFAYLVDGKSLESEAWRVAASWPVCLYVGRARPGQYHVQNQTNAIRTVTLGGSLLKADIEKLGEATAYRVDESFTRVGPVAIRVTPGRIEMMVEPEADYELTFAGVKSLRESRAEEERAAEEAARLAKLPPIPAFPVGPFKRPDGAPSVTGESIKIQAEDFCAEGMGKVEKTTKKIGMDGAAFLRWDSPGHFLEWKVNIPKDGEYTLTFRYCTEPKDATRAIVIDGKYPAEFCRCCPFPSTGGFSNEQDDWKSLTLADPKTKAPLRVYLKAGEHSLKVFNYNGPVNLDCIVFSTR